MRAAARALVTDHTFGIRDRCRYAGGGIGRTPPPWSSPGRVVVFRQGAPLARPATVRRSRLARRRLTVESFPSRATRHAPAFGQSPLRSNVRRGASTAPQLPPAIPTLSAPFPGENRAAVPSAPPRWAPAGSCPAESIRWPLRSGRETRWRLIRRQTGVTPPSPVCGRTRKPTPRLWSESGPEKCAVRRRSGILRSGRTSGAARSPRRTSHLRFRRHPLRSLGKTARPCRPRPAGLRLDRARRSQSAERSVRRGRPADGYSSPDWSDATSSGLRQKAKTAPPVVE